MLNFFFESLFGIINLSICSELFWLLCFRKLFCILVSVNALNELNLYNSFVVNLFIFFSVKNLDLLILSVDFESLALF